MYNFKGKYISTFKVNNITFIHRMFTFTIIKVIVTMIKCIPFNKKTV